MWPQIQLGLHLDDALDLIRKRDAEGRDFQGLLV